MSGWRLVCGKWRLSGWYVEIDDCVDGGWNVDMCGDRGEVSMRKWMSVDGSWYGEMGYYVDGG